MQIRIVLSIYMAAVVMFAVYHMWLPDDDHYAYAILKHTTLAPIYVVITIKEFCTEFTIAVGMLIQYFCDQISQFISTVITGICNFLTLIGDYFIIPLRFLYNAFISLIRAWIIPFMEWCINQLRFIGNLALEVIEFIWVSLCGWPKRLIVWIWSLLCDGIMYLYTTLVEPMLELISSFINWIIKSVFNFVDAIISHLITAMRFLYNLVIEVVVAITQPFIDAVVYICTTIGYWVDVIWAQFTIILEWIVLAVTPFVTFIKSVFQVIFEYVIYYGTIVIDWFIWCLYIGYDVVAVVVSCLAELFTVVGAYVGEMITAVYDTTYMYYCTAYDKVILTWNECYIVIMGGIDRFTALFH